jgi:ankyrin repeat protein
LGCTPLYNAVSQDHAKAVQSLLRLGASPDIRSELGKTPLELARLKGLPEIVALFSNPAA